MTKTLIALCVAGAFVCTARAQTTVATPTTSQLEREHARIEAERKALFDPANPGAQAKKGGMPSGTAIEHEMRKIEAERKALFDPNNPATRDTPNTFPRVETPAPSHVDLEALAQRYEQKAQARRADGLMVFASFTMPKESLKRLIAETARAGGAVVLRGFLDGSLKKTSVAINELGEASGVVQINPNAFHKYRVTAVPAVVLVKPEGIEQVDADGCALPDKYVTLAGDVGLGYALEEIENRSPEFQAMAARYGRPLKEKVR